MSDQRDVLFPVTFGFPLSGNVDQVIAPFTQFFGPSGNQIGLFNVRIGTSIDPELEQRIVETTGSYGKQIGRIGEALAVLIDHLEKKNLLDGLDDPARKAIRSLRSMVDDIEDVKKTHGLRHRRAGG